MINVFNLINKQYRPHFIREKSAQKYRENQETLIKDLQFTFKTNKENLDVFMNI